jgi:putative NADPH-quinone reductase
MAISIILAHPNKGSFNHAIAQAAATTLRDNGHAVLLHDLYAEGFDPILAGEEIPKNASLAPAIEAHCREIRSAHGIIIVHPNWWGQPPAILKGWIDRVFRQGVAYEFGTNDKGEGVPVGLLSARTAVIFHTANTPADREREIFGDPLDGLWTRCIFQFCGVKDVRRRLYTPVIISTPEQRAAWLQDVRETVARAFPPA